ncbi:MAG: hypothetical protein NC307_01125 [Roseburia sp.]|nr:hypothetical protein [Roseburia sp.]
MIFKGKQHIDWRAVETYVLRYIGGIYIIAFDRERINVDKKFYDELNFER